MIKKIKLHIFLGATTLIFGWYYVVDTLPRSRLIEDYVTRISSLAYDAVQEGSVASLTVEQPMFYVDNPSVAVHPGDDGAFSITFSNASRRRCDQIVSNAYVKRVAAQVRVSGGACGAMNEVTLVMPRK